MGVIVSEEELKNHAFAFLEDKNLMALATSYRDMPHVVTIPYVIASEFELVFYARPGTIYTDNIEKNDHVSAVITEIPIHNSKFRSVQIKGKVRKVDGVEWNVYYPLYEKRFKDAKNHLDHIIYVIKPEEIWMIDEKAFGHSDRTKVL